MIGYIAGLKMFKLSEPKILKQHLSTVILKDVYVKKDATREEVRRFLVESGLVVPVRRL